MEKVTQQSDAPQNVFKAIKQGFELTTRKLWILLVPLLFDGFLWLGPRLRIGQLVRQQYELLLANFSAETMPIDSAMLPQFYELIERVNLFAMLRTPLYGVPSLMNLFAPLKAPITPQEIAIADVSTIFQYGILLFFVGLICSGLYYSLVATLVQQEEGAAGQIRSLPGNILRVTLHGLLLCLILLVATVPIMLVTSIAAIFSMTLGYLVIMFGSVLVMWILIFVTFSIHALLLEDLSPLRAMVRSVQFMRKNSGQALPLLLIIFISNSILNRLWLLADDGSWFTLVSLLGHAFIATSLVVATFVFYKENALTPAV